MFSELNALTAGYVSSNMTEVAAATGHRLTVDLMPLVKQ